MEMNNHYVGLQRLFSRFTKMRYINGWIIFSFDLIISLSVSLIGVLGLLSFLGVSYTQEDFKRRLCLFGRKVDCFLYF